jgi:hypothetical protein
MRSFCVAFSWISLMVGDCWSNCLFKSDATDYHYKYYWLFDWMKLLFKFRCVVPLNSFLNEDTICNILWFRLQSRVQSQLYFSLGVTTCIAWCCDRMFSNNLIGKNEQFFWKHVVPYTQNNCRNLKCISYVWDIGHIPLATSSKQWVATPVGIFSQHHAVWFCLLDIKMWPRDDEVICFCPLGHTRISSKVFLNVILMELFSFAPLAIPGSAAKCCWMSYYHTALPPLELWSMLIKPFWWTIFIIWTIYYLLPCHPSVSISVPINSPDNNVSLQLATVS